MQLSQLTGFLKIQRDFEIQRIKLERKKIAETMSDPTEKKKFLKEPILVKQQRLRIKFVVENDHQNGNK